MKKIDLIFIAVITIATIALINMENNFKHDTYTNAHTAKGIVVEADNEEVHTRGVVQSGVQNLRVLVKEGVHKGDTVKTFNTLTSQKAIDRVYKVGEPVLLVLNNDKLYGFVRGYYRLNYIFLLSALFVLFLVVFSGTVGLKTVLSFSFTVVVLWKVIVPGYLKGYNPWVLTVGILSVLDFIVLFMANGLNRVGFVTFLGSISGIVTTAFLSLVFGALFDINGAVKEYSEPLLYNGYMHLDLTQIFLVGIFISASGAIMDIATDVAASQREILSHKPDITMVSLIKSGFNVSRPVISTMSTTLLFAYAGSNIFLLMLMSAEGHLISEIINSKVFSAHILQTLVGSFGVIVTAPLTALIGGAVYTKMENNGMRCK